MVDEVAIIGERPDPVDDRDEFQKRVARTSCWRDFYSQGEILDAMLEGDAVKLQEMKDLKSQCEAHVAQYMADYDAAADRRARQAVVGGVKRYERPA